MAAWSVAHQDSGDPKVGDRTEEDQNPHSDPLFHPEYNVR